MGVDRGSVDLVEDDARDSVDFLEELCDDGLERRAA